MEKCYQFKDMNMLQHGQSVHEWYKDMVGPRKYEWDFGKCNTVIDNLISLGSSPSELEDYHVFHDLGKPFCRTVDETGKQHFPNHAEVSYNTWISAGGDLETAWYILHDMDFHILKGDEINKQIEDPRSVNLLLTAWCEVHANAQMFGGIESTSFKIKRKTLEKHSKTLLRGLNMM